MTDETKQLLSDLLGVLETITGEFTSEHDVVVMEDAMNGIGYLAMGAQEESVTGADLADLINRIKATLKPVETTAPNQLPHVCPTDVDEDVWMNALEMLSEKYGVGYCERWLDEAGREKFDYALRYRAEVLEYALKHWLPQPVLTAAEEALSAIRARQTALQEAT